MLLLNIYYNLKPLIPRSWQLYLRRQLIIHKLKTCKNIWPINAAAGKPPDTWPGWPDQKRFAVVLTHDVEMDKGRDKCEALVKLEENLGFRSAFYFVPERYHVPSMLLNQLISRGFEVGIHGLYHDGNLYKSRDIFQQRAVRINHYLDQWGAVGFRSPAMHHNLDWLHELNIEYDASTFDTDPFEPQSDGSNTIFPFFVDGNEKQKGYVELSYTLSQDFTLFVLMRENTIDIWKRKIEWIAENGGMALVDTHPDYMSFNQNKLGREEYPVELYEEFLQHIKNEYKDQYWHVLPKQVAQFYKEKCHDCF